MARVSLSTLLDRSSRNMDSRTLSVVRDSALKAIKLAYAEGINAQISEGYRSYARQNKLYQQGRTTGGLIVTNARGGYSNHNHGVAVDFFLTTKNGDKAVWTVNKKWRRFAQIGKNLGFSWGGDWSSFKDYPHLEMTGGLSTAQMRAGRKPNLKMKGGSVGYVPSKPTKQPKLKWINKDFNWTGQVLKHGHKGKAVKQLQKKLSDAYFYPDKSAKNNGIDKYYGSDTTDAVRRYQRMNGLKEDGVAGKAVYASLGGKKKPKKSVASKLPNGVLRRGDKGKKVKKLQRALNKANYKVGKVDGIYGKKTHDAVRRVQLMKETNRKYIDGVYGKRTKKYIKELL